MKQQLMSLEQTRAYLSEMKGNLPATQVNFVDALAAKSGMDPAKYFNTIKNTVFAEASNEECNALLMIAREYNLNPLLKEIYAFRTQSGGIMPLVPIDGWITMVNRHQKFNGYSVEYPPEEKWVDRSGKKCPAWIEVVMYRKDSERPYPHREYMDECWKDTGPWKSHPKRMLKHKAFIQSARYALGYSGIYDEDEAGSIIDVTPIERAAAGISMDLSMNHGNSSFDSLAQEAGVATSPDFQTFLEECSRANGKSVEDLKQYASGDFQNMMLTFNAWAAKRNADQPAPRTANRPSRDERPGQQAEAQADTRATVLCPRRQNSDGDNIEVLASVCATCSGRDDCPALQG